MSGYLSKLVARAGGDPGPVAIAPGPRPPLERETGSDPFEASAAPEPVLPPSRPPAPGLPSAALPQPLPPLQPVTPARPVPAVQDVAAGIVPVAERTASDQAESAPPPRQRVLEREEPPIPLT